MAVPPLYLADFKDPNELIERFERHTLKTEGCWPWQLKPDNNGYGVISVHLADGRKTRLYATRLALLLHYGELSADTLACHNCDNPICVRVHPDHVYRGTYSTNARDMYRRHRAHPNFHKGEESKGHKLTDSIVLEMKARHARGETYGDLGHEYGVSQTVARRAVVGLDWRHLREAKPAQLSEEER